MMVAGIAALGLEVLWTRALVLVVGTSAYAFVTVLTSFLLGIGIGGFTARWILQRVKNLRRLLGWIQMGIAVSVLATLPTLRYFTVGPVQEWIDRFQQQWMMLTFARFDICLLVMLVPTTLMGMTFPVAGKLWASQPDAVGRQLGQLYAANTTGKHRRFPSGRLLDTCLF